MTVTRDEGFMLEGSHDGERLNVEVRAYDAVGNASATWQGEILSADPDAAHTDDDGVDDTDNSGLPGERVDALGDSIADFEGEDNDFPPGVVPSGASTRSASFGIRVTEPDEATARSAVSIPAPTRCGRESYDGVGPQDTFRIKFGRKGTTPPNMRSDPYYQFHLHHQVRRPLWPNIARTWLAATRTMPSGIFDPSPFDDSDTRRGRGADWKPYYAHFLRLQVKPGSLITYWGPVDVQGARSGRAAPRPKGRPLLRLVHRLAQPVMLQEDSPVR